MINYDKSKIREALRDEDIYDLLVEFGGEPQRSPFGFISRTICHNADPAGASHKLYYYYNTQLFKCYSGCAESIFDPFELVIKVAKLQWDKEFDLNTAVRWIAQKFGIDGERVEDDEDELEDWKYFADYDRVQDIELKAPTVVLKEYDEEILDKFNYDVKISPWIKEGISQKVLRLAQIGYYPGGDQITIPHFDKDNRLIGLRGRTLCAEEAELYGKYRPLKVNGQWYNHPLGMNLYGLGWNKEHIKIIKKAIVFESEKSVLQYASYFGWENNICVACCGSSLSAQQVQLLLDLGVEEIIIAFDRQFQKIGDEEFKKLKENLIRLRNKYKNYVNISFIFDSKMITGYKDSPTDQGPTKFLQLFKERIVL